MTSRGRRLRYVTLYGWMALAYAAFIVGGSLTPFILRRGPIPEWTIVARYMWSVPLDPADAVANVLLFLPLGFLLTSVSGSWGAGACRPVLVTVACTMLSGSIEAAQVFAAYRYPSVTDIALNALGAGLGAALWTVIGRNLTTLLWLGLRRFGKRARIVIARMHTRMMVS